MYNVTQAFKEAIKKNGRQFKASITMRDIIFDDNSIIDLSLSEDVNPTDSFMLGAVASSAFDLTIVNPPDTLILEGAKVSPVISLNTGNVFEDVPLGIFWVDKIEKGKSTVKLNCFDSMIKLEKPYFSDLSYPTSISNVAQEICTKAGIELASILPNTLINEIEGYTCREAIGFIASFLGGFARFNRQGKLEITTYSDSSVTITSDNYFGNPTFGEKNFTIGKLTCKAGQMQDSEGNAVDKIITAGSSGNEIAFENPIMTQAQLDNIYNTLKTLSYMPYSMEWQGNHALQAGDKISITDVKGNTYNTLLMQQKVTYKGGMSASAIAVGKTAQAQEFNSGGSLKNKVDRMVVEQANIKLVLAEKVSTVELEAVNARIDNVIATTVTTTQFIATTARISTLETTTAHITNGIIDNATIDVAKVNNLSSTYATITNLTAVNANLQTVTGDVASIKNVLAGNVGASNLAAGAIQAGSAVIANGAISSAQISSLDVTKLIAGDISTSKFRIVSSSGNMLLSDNTIQIKDASRVRVQIGKDASNDYNMYVWDASGNLMFDATGLKASGIKSKIIVDNMVSDAANISGSKIEKESLVTQINGATTTLKSSRVKLDTENQTLDVAFTSLKSTVTSQGSTISSQGTSISTIQGQISSKVWSTDITTAVNNVQVGSRNLTLDSGFENSDITANWLFATSSSWNIGTVYGVRDSSVHSIYGSYSCKCGNGSGLGLGIAEKKQGTSAHPVMPGQTYQLGFDVYSADSATQYIVCIRCYDSTGANVSGTVARSFGWTYSAAYGAFCQYTTIPSANVWNRIVYPFMATAGVSYVALSLMYYTGGTSKYIWFDNIKFEQGTKSTDWTPAPEDTQSQIDGATTRISTAESNINQLTTSISLKVDTSTFNSYKTSNDSAVSALTSRVSSAELKITDNAIVSTVRSSTAYLGDLSGKVGNSEIISKINQTAEAIKIQANKIDLTGYVTINSLSSTGSVTINCGNISGGTLTLGGAGNGNGWVSLKNASNVTMVSLDNTGLYNSSGTFKVTDSKVYFKNAEIADFIGGQTTDMHNVTRPGLQVNINKIKLRDFNLSAQYGPDGTGELYTINVWNDMHAFTISQEHFDTADNLSNYQEIFRVSRSGAFALGSRIMYDRGYDGTDPTLQIKDPASRNGICARYGDGPVGYNYGGLITMSSSGPRFQMYAPHNEGGVSALYFRTGWNDDIKDWKRVATYGERGYFYGVEANADIRAVRLLGYNSRNIYIGDGTDGSRMDAGDGGFRLYTSWVGNADYGLRINSSGGIDVLVNNSTKFSVSSSGSKVGGTYTLDGIDYGMSPIDSPRSLIEDVYIDVEVQEEGTTIKLDILLARMMDKYAVFVSNTKVEVVSKDKSFFVVKGYTGNVDIRIIGLRKDCADQYFPIMNDLVA